MLAYLGLHTKLVSFASAIRLHVMACKGKTQAKEGEANPCVNGTSAVRIYT
jgi:hypothetical protein